MKMDVVYNKSCQRMDELPNDSIDCTITSPPYWGLRDYGDDVKQIWGGDFDCQHKFDALLPGHHPGQVPQTKKQVASGSKDSGQFCSLCGAWYGQLGLEPTFQLYLDHMAAVCAEVMRVLKGTGSFFLNLGDTYGGSGAKGEHPGKEIAYSPAHSSKGYAKCLLSIPWRLALRLVDEQGWILRNAIVWAKPNAMPSSVKDRCSNSYEFLFHLVKVKKYYYDLDAIRQPYTEPLNRWGGNKIKVPEKTKWKSLEERAKWTASALEKKSRPYSAGKNPGDVWTIPTQPRPEAHFATFPDALCIKPILATCPQEICKECGKARVRIIEVNRPSDYNPSIVDERYQEHCRKSGGTKGTNRPLSKIFKDSLNTTRQTTGWTDCGCNAGFEPGIVLDPFAGRGTALVMAKKLGRHYVGYELKKEYCEKLIEPALRDIDPLFNRRNYVEEP